MREPGCLACRWRNHILIIVLFHGSLWSQLFLVGHLGPAPTKYLQLKVSLLSFLWCQLQFHCIFCQPLPWFPVFYQDSLEIYPVACNSQGSITGAQESGVLQGTGNLLGLTKAVSQRAAPHSRSRRERRLVSGRKPPLARAAPSRYFIMCFNTLEIDMPLLLSFLNFTFIFLH